MTVKKTHISALTLTCLFAALSLFLVPHVGYAQSFSFQTYPNNGWNVAGCNDSACARVYQYSPNNYGFSYAQPNTNVVYTYNQAPRYTYTYQQPQYVNYYAPQYTYARQQPTPYIPYFVIQQQRPSYYQQANPYAYYNDFYAAQMQWDNTVRMYNAY